MTSHSGGEVVPPQGFENVGWEDWTFGNGVVMVWDSNRIRFVTASTLLEVFWNAIRKRSWPRLKHTTIPCYFYWQRAFYVLEPQLFGTVSSIPVKSMRKHHVSPCKKHIQQPINNLTQRSELELCFINRSHLRSPTNILPHNGFFLQPSLQLSIISPCVIDAKHLIQRMDKSNMGIKCSCKFFSTLPHTPNEGVFCCNRWLAAASRGPPLRRYRRYSAARSSKAVLKNENCKKLTWRECEKSDTNDARFVCLIPNESLQKIGKFQQLQRSWR